MTASEIEEDEDLLYDIKPTSYGGRSAFARKSIPKGTSVLFCTAPYATVIFWKFRREVCAWCFAYSFESGKSKWSVKLGEDSKGSGGAWFCGEECRDVCIRENEVFEGQGVQWWTEINGAFERLVLQMGKPTKQKIPSATSHAATAALAYLEDPSSSDVTPEFIHRAWTLAEEVSLAESKQGWKNEWTEVLNELEIDTARFVLDGLVRKAIEDVNPVSPMLSRVETGVPGHCLSAGRWADYLKLQDNELALMRSKPYMLGSRIRIYRFLSHLATSLLSSQKHTRSGQATPHDQSATVHIAERLRAGLFTSTESRALMARDHGNVFGIWDMSTEDEGSEMLGWAAYIFGSYFNHHCEPNLKKTRSRRGIQFHTLRDIEEGEELCISYSDGNSVQERIDNLERDWFFTCCCGRCVEDLKVAAAPAA